MKDNGENRMPKISVVVPVYKVEKYIRRCIDSILCQSFSDFDLIIVDDGSPDNCPRICDEYKEKDKRIHVIHQKNCGLSGARNAGIEYSLKNSDSKWITFIDSDDWITPDCISMLYKGVVDNSVDISVIKTEHVDDDYSLKIKRDTESSFAIYNADDFYKFFSLQRFGIFSITAWGKLYNKKIFADIRYPIGKQNEDQYVTYKLIFNAGRIAVSRSLGYLYYKNQNSIMNSDWNPKKMDAFGSFEDEFVFFESRNAKWAYRVAVLHLLANSCLQLVSIIRTDYRKSDYTAVIVKYYLKSLAKVLSMLLHYLYNFISVRILVYFFEKNNL